MPQCSYNINRSANLTDFTGSDSECTSLDIVYVYVIALAGILLVAIGFVLTRLCSSVVSRIIHKKRRHRFIRNTASRSKQTA